MRWDLSFKRQALGDPVSEGRRVWEWIQQIRPLHPSLTLWRPTADSPQEAEQSPPITQDYLLRLTHYYRATQLARGAECRTQAPECPPIEGPLPALPPEASNLVRRRRGSP